MEVQKHRTIYFLLCLPLLVQTQKPEAVKTLDPFQRDCLDAHNTYRSQHGVPPLVWSAELAQHAQSWADELASRDEVKHDLVAISKHDEGENLAFFHPAVPKCQGSMEGNCVLCREMVERWYDEGKNYDYDSGHSKNPERITKHFTQILWANTSEVGIGTSVSKKYGFITVARYRPGGNRGGADAFVVNVPPEGGPLPSLSNDSPKLNSKSSKSSTSTTPTGNGIPVTNPDTSKPPQASQTMMKTLSDSDAVSNKKDVSSTLTGSLDGSSMEKIQANPLGHVMNDEAQNKLPKKAASLLSMIVDLANKTKPENNNNNNNNNSNNNQGAAEGNQSKDRPQGVKSNLAGKSGQEESSLETIHNNFSYENANSMYNNGIDSATTPDIADSLNGNHGNAVGVTKPQDAHDRNQGQEKSSPGPKNAQVDKMEKSGGVDRTQGNKSNVNNTLIDKEQDSGLSIHTDNGLIAGGNDIQKDLKNRGLVRTVKGPDGTNAQVFLTKNGAHAGLVFRDYISRASPKLKQHEFVRSRIIHVL